MSSDLKFMRLELRRILVFVGSPPLPESIDFFRSPCSLIVSKFVVVFELLSKRVLAAGDTGLASRSLLEVDTLMYLMLSLLLLDFSRRLLLLFVALLKFEEEEKILLLLLFIRLILKNLLLSKIPCCH